ncbi:MAG: FAD-binding protein [Eggerthellaceae bacterium]|nr:FAD-binding protein [Eggerthellaceae bacterium]MCH4220969.1 FAD-binding protein [Eggerthellaceae bacterium]
MSKSESRPGISRRELFKLGGVAAAGVVGAGALSACSPKSSSTKDATTTSSSSGASSEDMDYYMCKNDWLGSAPKTGDPSETYDCDILVLGGGHAGIHAALAAAEGGASVMVAEMTSEANRKVKGEDIGHVNSQWLINQGYGPYDVGEVTREFVRRSGGRCNQEIIRKFVANSGEAVDHLFSLISWPNDRIKVNSADANPELSPLDPSQVICQVSGATADGPVSYPIICGGNGSYAAVAQFMGTIVHEPQQGVAAFSRLDEVEQFAILAGQDKGAQWHYEETAIKLTQNDSGDITGAITQKADGSYVQYNTSIGVILCTGDYAANADMVWNLNTELAEMNARQGLGASDSTGFSTSNGAGQKMACWAGGVMQPAPRACMAISGGGGGPWGTAPYLWLNADGKRFCNEANSVGMQVATWQQPIGNITTVTDANWYETTKNAGLDHGAPNYGRPVYFEEMKQDMAAIPLDDANGGTVRGCTIAERMAATVFASNTLEGALKLAGYDGASLKEAVAQIAAYNKLCAAGDDTEYGKEAIYMKPINTAPFYVCPSKNTKTTTAGLVTLAGIMTDDDLQAVDAKGDTIKGLWAAGNCLGGRYGNAYATPFAGNSIGMAITHGRVAGKLATGQTVL